MALPTLLLRQTAGALSPPEACAAVYTWSVVPSFFLTVMFAMVGMD
jgi:hypothetical protein